ncbi:PREDICTED: uncharacterized protein LOC101314145 [Fragaria vesca subsp. vesca]
MYPSLFVSFWFILSSFFRFRVLQLGCKAIFTILIVVLFFFRSPVGSGSETGSGTHGGCKAAATGSPSGSASHGITVSEAHINSQAQIDPQVSTDCTLPATPSALFWGMRFADIVA